MPFPEVTLEYAVELIRGSEVHGFYDVIDRIPVLKAAFGLVKPDILYCLVERFAVDCRQALVHKPS
jgi:hypothetical protein